MARNPAESASIDVAIIGAGVIGLASAFELAAAGREVVLFDTAPGRGASFGNAGGITPGWVAPTATPAYAQVQIYRAGSLVPLTLDGVTLGTIAVNDVIA